MALKFKSNITIHHKTQIELDLKKNLHIDLYKFLVCQECEEVPKYGLIYTCDAGDHATCKYCFETSKVCKCKCNDNIKNRSKALEHIRTTLPLACKNRKNGCNAILAINSLLCHEVDCQFRGIFCPVLSCTKEVGNIVFNNLGDHLTEHHKDIDNDNGDTSYIDSGFVVDERVFASNAAWSPEKLVLKKSSIFPGDGQQKGTILYLDLLLRF
jgi:hypothetical protein